MRIGKEAWLVGLGAVAVAAAGCGGSSSHSTNPGAATTEIQTGATDVGTVLASPSATTNQQTLQNAASEFAQAWNNNPSGQAAVGYAICQGAVDAGSLASLFGETNIPYVAKAAAAMNILKTGTPPMAGPSSATDLLPINLAAHLIKPTGKGITPAQITIPTYAQVESALETVQKDIQTELSWLTNANIQSLETNPLTVTYGTKTVAIGQVEGFALRAGLEATLGAIDAALAYNLNTTYSTFSQSFATTYPTLVNGTTPITASQYLPAAPFLSLNSGGSAMLQNMSTELLASASDVTTAVTDYGARGAAPANDTWLASLWTITTDQENSLTNGAAMVKTVLTSTVTETLTDDWGFSATLNINVSAWTGGTAPATLAAFFPSLQATANPGGDVMLSPIAGSISDPTFGGLFVGGVPSSFLYPDGEQIDSGNTVGDVDVSALLEPFTLLSFGGGSSTDRVVASARAVKS